MAKGSEECEGCSVIQAVTEGPGGQRKVRGLAPRRVFRMVGAADASTLRWRKIRKAIWLSKQGEGGKRQVSEARGPRSPRALWAAAAAAGVWI